MKLNKQTAVVGCIVAGLMVLAVFFIFSPHSNNWLSNEEIGAGF